MCSAVGLFRRTCATAPDTTPVATNLVASPVVTTPVDNFPVPSPVVATPVYTTPVPIQPRPGGDVSRPSGTILESIPPDSVAADDVKQPTPPSDNRSSDEVNFEQHWSVAYWRNYSNEYFSEVNSLEIAGPDRLRQYLQKVAQAMSVQAGGASTATDAAYWAYHLFRMTSFVAFTASGLVLAAASKAKLNEAEVKSRMEFMSPLPVEDIGQTWMVCLLPRISPTCSYNFRALMLCGDL